ncbi:MAG: hypothetical protein AAF127_00055 [Pseudomonadota bacterium]
MALRVPKRLYYYPTVSRIFAALIGGYLFANVMSLLIFFAFVDTDLLYMETEGVNRELVASGFDAATAASILSLVIFTLAGIWVFYAKSAARAWAVMIVPSIIGIGLIYLLLPSSLQQAIGG